jgi:16S rRNA C967 or C1407 C5-methylase (RsmB/RsmF family)/NOL1/NOP2/fmu family ribosome biogenesis protein
MPDKISPRLPDKFLAQLTTVLDSQGIIDFQKSLAGCTPTSIRYNQHKPIPVAANVDQVPWCPDAYYLSERPSFTLDPCFHAGAYYVQEASSTFLHHILKSLQLPESSLILDLCAAPGGKSTLLGSFIGESGMLIANEVIKNRAQILKENIIKWGLGNTVVTQNDPSHFSALEALFDLVLVDAPCSGEGMFRKDPAAVSEWSPENVTLCAARQKRIIDQVGVLPKGGGYLIYATCTYNRKENEENISFLASEFAYEPVRIPIPAEWGIQESIIEVEQNSYFGYRFFPHQVKGEGFFVSVLRRSGNNVQTVGLAKEFRHPHLTRVGIKGVPVELSSKLDMDKEMQFYQLGESYFLIHKGWQGIFEKLVNTLQIKYFGVELGQVIHGEWLPSHEWALSVLEKKNIPRLELSREEALSFLRKESILADRSQKGWHLVTYLDLPIGWIKNLGNRVNNYYPKAWRIRS